MATPKKRPSVKNKKIVRPASRQVVARVDASGEQGVSSGAPAPASQAPDAGLFPDIPAAPKPPEAHIPFADAAPVHAGTPTSARVRFTQVGAAAGVGGEAGSGSANDAGAPSTSSGASSTEDGPADFFDLGDGGASAGGAGSRSSSSRSAQGSSRPSGRRAVRPRARANEDDAARSQADDAGQRPHSRIASGRGSRSEAATRREKDASGKRGIKKIVLGIVGAVALAAVVVGAFLVWNAFFRYDDAADIQGEWRTQDNAMTVVIDGSNIRMPDLEYSYEIDTASKRLTFHFSGLTGSGTYSFSSDRSTLTIVEGEGDAATTTVFTKVSDSTQATPQLIDPAASSDAAADGEGASENAEESGDAAASEEAADEGGEGSGEESGDAAASDDAGDSDGASGGADASNDEAQA